MGCNRQQQEQGIGPGERPCLSRLAGITDLRPQIVGRLHRLAEQVAVDQRRYPDDADQPCRIVAGQAVCRADPHPAPDIRRQHHEQHCPAQEQQARRVQQPVGRKAVIALAAIAEGDRQAQVVDGRPAQASFPLPGDGLPVEPHLLDALYCPT